MGGGFSKAREGSSGAPAAPDERNGHANRRKAIEATQNTRQISQAHKKLMKILNPSYVME
jgi:hypothetical protein